MTVDYVSFMEFDDHKKHNIWLSESNKYNFKNAEWNVDSLCVLKDSDPFIKIVIFMFLKIYIFK